MGKGWVKWSKILNYFKLSQKYPLRFKKIKLAIIFLRFDKIVFLGHFKC